MAEAGGEDVVSMSEAGVGSLSMIMPRFPEIEVRLTGRNGNALVLVGAVREALRRAGLPDELITEFTDDALSDDYNHVLITCVRWVTVS